MAKENKPIVVKSMDLDQVRNARYDKLVELAGLMNSKGNSKNEEARKAHLQKLLETHYTKKLISNYISEITSHNVGAILYDDNEALSKSLSGANYIYCNSNQLDNRMHPLVHYKQVADSAKANFKTTSVVDIINDDLPGNYFMTNAVQLVKKPQLDESKFLTIYGQMHEIAIQHPKEEIEFYFYDNNPTTLKKLSETFEKNALLVPGNIKLIFDSIPSGKKVELQGVGSPNEEYKDIIKVAYGECVKVSRKNSNFNAIDKLGRLTAQFGNKESLEQAIIDRDEVRKYKNDMGKLIVDLQKAHTSVFTNFINYFIPLHRYTMIETLKKIQAGTYNNADEIKQQLETYSKQVKPDVDSDKKLGQMFKTMKDKFNLEKPSESSENNFKPK